MENILTLESDKLRVLISPVVGGSIFSMEYKYEGEWLHIMRPTTSSALKEGNSGDFASFNLIPFSNRIENGLLKYRGREYVLDINNPDGHTIHGEVRQRALKVEHSDSSKIIMSFKSDDFDDISWPFPFYAEIVHELIGDSCLSTYMKLKNVGEITMPGGMGIHPYFMRKLTDVDNRVDLCMPIKGIYPGDTTIPTGHYVDVEERLDFSEGKELTDEFLDNCFAIGNGDITISWPGSGISLKMEKDDIFSHGIIYCPKEEKEFFAIEPVTNCNNAFNMAEAGIKDTGTIYIEPGDSIEGSIKIEIKDTK